MRMDVGRVREFEGIVCNNFDWFASYSICMWQYGNVWKIYCSLSNRDLLFLYSSRY